MEQFSKSSSPEQLMTEHYQPLATFVLKTYAILAQPQNASIIAWKPDGLSFIINDITLLVNRILPFHFRHNQYASFIRQLNMYSFRKIKSLAGQAFANPYFRRDREDLLKYIRRKPENKKKQCSTPSLSSEPPTQKVDTEVQSSRLQSYIQQAELAPVEEKPFLVEIQSSPKSSTMLPGRTKRVNFQEEEMSGSREDNENYSTIIQASSKWLHKDDSCWQKIKSFRSIRVSMKLLEEGEEECQQQKCVLAESLNRNRLSCHLLEANTFKHITQ